LLGAAAPDRVFASIERHRMLYRAWAAIEVSGALASTDPQYDSADEASDEAHVNWRTHNKTARN
jgi:hypothetical protein